MLISVILFAIGLVRLIKGGDWFVDGATGIAKRFNLPDIVWAPLSCPSAPLCPRSWSPPPARCRAPAPWLTATPAAPSSERLL